MCHALLAWFPGSKLLTARLALRLVLLILPGIAAAAPTVAQGPVNVLVPAGQNATFTVAATGSGTLTYRWRRNGTPLVGATSSTLVIPRARRADAGFYSVEVTDATGSATPGPARLEVAPTRYPTLLAPDFSEPVQFETTARYEVRDIAVLADGSFVAVGDFSRVGDVRRANVVKIRADGRVDESFVPPLFDADVRAVAVLPDGKILVGGAFLWAGQHRRALVARLNPDGSLDQGFRSEFAPVGEIVGLWAVGDGQILAAGSLPGGAVVRLHADGAIDRSYTSGYDSYAEAGVMQPDGKLVLVGYDWRTGTYRLLRVLPSGGLDPSFVPPPASGGVQSMAVDAKGRIYLAGYFYSLGGESFDGLARVGATGALDATFRPELKQSYGGPGFGSGVEVQPDGRILIGGAFETVNGVSRSGMARLLEDGRVDPNFEPPALAGPRMASAFAVLPGGMLAVGRTLNSAGVVPPEVGLFRVRTTGAPDLQSFFMLRGKSRVTHVATLTTGKHLVTGGFTHVNGKEKRGLARLNEDLSVDDAFSSGSTMYEGNFLAALPNGGFALLGYGTVPFGGGYMSEGPGLYLFDQAGAVVARPTLPAAAVFEALAVGPEGQIAIAGRTNENSGHVTVVTSSGALSWMALSLNQPAESLAFQDDGKLLAGGWFTSVGGVARRYLARFNGDGTLDAGFMVSDLYGAVHAIAPLRDGRILLGTNGIIRVMGDGARDATWQQRTSNGVYGLWPQEDGRVMAAVLSYANPQQGTLQRYLEDGGIDATLVAAGPTTVQGRPSLVMRDNGELLATGLIADGGLYLGRHASAPVIQTQPQSTTAPVGASRTFTVAVTSSLGVSYQWYFNGEPIVGATGPTHTVTNFRAGDAGTYQVRITSDFGTATSQAVTLDAPRDPRGHLSNVSVRTAISASTGPVIVGFALGGKDTAGDTTILARGIGPTLLSYGLANALPDPRVEAYDVTGLKIDENDDWRGVFDFATVGAFALAGPLPKDAAIYNPYARAGAQTFHVIAKPATSGVVLAELYDARPVSQFTTLAPRFVNCSARARVGAGDDALILGFVVTGDTPVRLLVRAAGPVLGAAPYHVPGTLADPVLEVYAGQTKRAQNDDWGAEGAEATMAGTFTSVGAFGFPAGSKDSAIVLTLEPGAYSAVVRGKNDTSGEALVELYEIPSE